MCELTAQQIFRSCKATSGKALMMAKKKTDFEVRERVRKWLRHERERYRKVCPNDKDFARVAGMSRPELSQILSGARSAGLDSVLKLRRFLHLDLNLVLFHDPPEVLEILDPQGARTGPRTAKRTGADGG